MEVASRRVAEDQHISLGNRTVFVPSLPYGKFTTVLVVLAVPIVSHIVFLGRGMDELIFDAVDLNLEISRQLPNEVEDFGACVFSIMFELLMGDHTAVPIPNLSLSPVCVFLFFCCILAMTDGLEHHILVVADQHLCIGHLHDSS